jgi:hypothetical protein
MKRAVIAASEDLASVPMVTREASAADLRDRLEWARARRRARERTRRDRRYGIG